ncbi:SurA N-terminal domain-containing protein [Parvibaculum sp.]|uniref:peptidylprolyl isomerase n=1 Tax=Parvibaculum sp. TaxID=2024848 RepID=UPI00320D7736
MLDTLRRGAGSWVAKLLMGLLVFSFGIWGIADIFRGYSSDSVARVGDTDIKLKQFEREFENQTKAMAQRLGQPLTREQARTYGVAQASLTRLIALAALDAGAKGLGLAASDEAVAKDIAADPNLQGSFGKFDRAAFEMALQRIGLTEKTFIADRRAFIERAQLSDVLMSGIDAPSTLLDAISTFQQETRVASYIILPPSVVGDIKDPDEKTLEAYHKKAAIHFTQPETRDFTIMTLTPADLAASISISDDELAKAYEQRRSEFDIPEKRTVDQIPFATKAAAEAADARLKKGEALDKIISEIGLTPADVALGVVTRDQMVSPAVADAAFALKAGEYSAPVQGPLGTVILHVTAIEPGKASRFEDVKSKLRTELANEKASSQVYDVQNGIEDARAGGASIEDIAAKNGLKTVKFTGVTEKGLTADGGKIAGLPEYKDMLTTVFRSEQGDQIPPGDTGNGGYYWLRVDGVKAAEVKPLDKVRADVIKLWKAEKRKADLDALAQSLVERGNKGESFDKLAASVGRTPLTSPEIKRFSESDTFSRIAVTRIFAAPQGGLAYGPVGLGDSLLVMQVKSVSDPKPDRQSADYKKISDDVRDALQTDMITTYIAALEKKLGVDVNTTLLERTLASDSAQ